MILRLLRRLRTRGRVTNHEPSYLSSEELAEIPTSLLLRDVVAHGCDRVDSTQLCARCRGKWEEIDRRLPLRTS